MEVLTAKLRAISVSFRRILDFNYHRTYPLPPPTTIVGLLGSALGLSDRELWNEYNGLNDISFAVLSLRKPGFAKDMWSIQKIKNGRISERSPYFRELLFYPEYVLIFNGDSKSLECVRDALNNPEYALSLGREDELVRVIDVQWERVEKGEPVFSGTVLPFDIREYKFSPIMEEGIFIEPPVIDKLPTSFSVDRKGIRHPKNKTAYTFVPDSLKISVNNLKGEVLSIGGRNFVWLR
ncbi:CRISPR-associated protein Cas5 [Aciduliprofundum boonei T469]|nr:CRISPR-associated protein Cas5 [Aciduliprofundum boonei T469]